MTKPLTIDIPFPTLDEITPDCVSLKIIQCAYASPVGELNAIMQYVYHSVCFECAKEHEIANIIESISVAEMIHLKILGELIYKLGTQPVFAFQPTMPFNFYNAKYVNYSCNLINMVEDDVIGERTSIRYYENMLKKLKNDKVAEVIERICIDEKLHLERLNEIYAKLKR